IHRVVVIRTDDDNCSKIRKLEGQDFCHAIEGFDCGGKAHGLGGHPCEIPAASVKLFAQVRRDGSGQKCKHLKRYSQETQPWQRTFSSSRDQPTPISALFKTTGTFGPTPGQAPTSPICSPRVSISALRRRDRPDHFLATRVSCRRTERRISGSIPGSLLTAQ